MESQIPDDLTEVQKTALKKYIKWKKSSPYSGLDIKYAIEIFQGANKGLKDYAEAAEHIMSALNP